MILPPHFKKNMNRILKILLIIFVFSISLFAFRLLPAYSQVSSAAFDPNCYFPRIGVAGEIDTIYGAQHNQGLGGGMINIGPEPGGSYGRISCDLVLDTSADRVIPPSIFTTGPNFNIHKLNVAGRFINTYYVQYFGHFRSTKYLDALAVGDPTGSSSDPARIYWQGDDGNYDTARYTQLMTSAPGKLFSDYYLMRPFHSKISSDTVEDIIYGANAGDTIDLTQERIYFIYFQGGERLYSQGKVALSDSVLYIGKLGNTASKNPWPLGLHGDLLAQGDFRGVGRNDFISGNGNNNLLYYHNDAPFSMKSLLHFDTLFSKWQNPNVGFSQNTKPIVMHAFPKPTGDSSVDFICVVSATIENGIGIFKGGKDFGSHRITPDSAAQIIYHPSHYDSRWQSLSFGVSLKDCGDMTGTGNRVLYIEGSSEQELYGSHFFYVLGNSIDDKADMFIGDVPNGGGSSGNLDTLVADNDNHGDVIMGLPGFGLDGPLFNGTIYLIHGSEKIPVSGRSVSTLNTGQNYISVYPNPVTTGTCILDLHSLELQDIDITLWDLLGRKVYSEHIYAPYMRPQYQILLNSFPSGTYTLEVIGKKFSQRIQLSLLK
jgi:hypothetical protein